jgi:2-methylisocitrate lyase-like PEP mutase family enzyme
MNPTIQREKALAFRKLHEGPSILVLPNAWDCLSAWIFEQAGFPAVATTSGGIASVFGYPDGQTIPSGIMLEMTGRIASVVSIPVTADLEAGYGTSPAQVAETISTAINLGLVGANLEDSTGDSACPLKEIKQQAEIIRAIRQAGDATGIPFFINARTDAFLHGKGDEATRLREAVERATAYREAGADGIFVIAVKEREMIHELARRIPRPLNILAGPGSPTISELQELGVARVTFGSGLLRGTLPFVRDMAKDLRQTASSGALAQTEFAHAAINQLFQSKALNHARDEKSAKSSTFILTDELPDAADLAVAKK